MSPARSDEPGRRLVPAPSGDRRCLTYIGRPATGRSAIPGVCSAMAFQRDVAIVGGCGHVGLPLGLALADAGLSVVLFDTNRAVVDTVAAGKMPFLEHGADEVL